MSKSRTYKAITEMEFVEPDVPTLSPEVLEADDEGVLSLSLVETLYSGFRHVDQLTHDGLWVHGAAGI